MKNKANIIIISIFFIILSILFWGKTENILIDFSRESFIPYQMTTGKILIKDIFLIYGPFGYIVNSLLYKLSTNINILFFEAHIISYFIVLSIYFIFNKFTNSKISLIFTIFFITTSIFSHSIFGFTIPYSYSTLWAIFAIYAIILAILHNKTNLIFILLGLILVNKIEFFIPVLLVVVLYLIFNKIKFTKNILLMLIIPLLTSFYFVFNKIEIADIINNINHLKIMVKTNSLEYLYKGVGSFFEIEYFKFNLVKLGIFLLICAISYLIYKKKPILSYFILIILLSTQNTNQSLNLLAFLILIPLIYLLKNHQIKKEELLLLCFSIILCSKSIFAINSLSYSNFGYCLLLFCLYLFLNKIFDNKWILTVFTTFFIVNIAANLCYIFINPKEKVKTPIGSIWLNKHDAKLFKDVNEYISKNIDKKESILVLPEGQMFNLIHKKEYNYYNSTFTPLDFETFKEETLTKNIENQKPDNIILFPRNTSDYGANTICINYGIDFCRFIMDNYTETQSVGEYYKAYIYKRKR